MPPQTRSKLQIQPLYPMGGLSIHTSDTFEESPASLHGKDAEDWDFRYGTPIRPALPKRKCMSVGVQTSPIEETFPHSPPALCRDSGSSTSSSPDPESDGDDTYAAKGSLKRKKSTSSNPVSQNVKKARSAVAPASPVKLAVAPKPPRRESIISLDGNSKPRSIYAPSPTPLQCSYVYPIALGPPRRPVDLRRAKGAKIIPEAQAAVAAPASTAPAATTDAPAGAAPMEVDDPHKITHRCPITFSREFEMRRHIRTVHIAEEIRAVVEGRLPRAEATVIPESWDGKTLLTKPTCSGCGTTFSRPDAVRRHQTEVNAKMENGICIECPGPKVHIRRGPRKDVHQTAQSPAPAPAPAPVAVPVAPVVAPVVVAPAPAVPVVVAAPVPAPVAPAADSVAALIPVVLAPASIALGPAASAPIETVLAPVPVESALAPAAVAAPVADPAAPPVAPTSTDPQPATVVRERAEPVEGELESEDDM